MVCGDTISGRPDGVLGADAGTSDATNEPSFGGSTRERPFTNQATATVMATVAPTAAIAVSSQPTTLCEIGLVCTTVG